MFQVMPAAFLACVAASGLMWVNANAQNAARLRKSPTGEAPAALAARAPIKRRSSSEATFEAPKN